MRRPRHRPLRTCVGCRAVGEQRTLIRFVADAEGGASVNPLRPQGRGAYLCPSLVCLAQACRRQAFSRAFRRDISDWERTAIQADFAAELSRRGIGIPEDAAVPGAVGEASAGGG